MIPGSEATQTSEPKTTFLGANAVDPDLDRKVMPQFYEWLTKGKVFENAESAALVVHGDIAGPLGLDDVQQNLAQPKEQWPVLLSPDKEGALAGEAVQVTGVIGSAVPTDKRLALAPLKTIQRVLKMEGQITEYIIRLDDVKNALVFSRNSSRFLDQPLRLVDGIKSFHLFRNCSRISISFLTSSLRFSYLLLCWES